MNNKNILVTGAARGIGAEITKLLAEQNAHVILSCRDSASGEKLKQAIISENPKAKITVLGGADTSDLDAMKHFIHSVKSVLNGEPLHGLILNAGVAGVKHQLSPQGFESQVATNVLGHHLLAALLINELNKGLDSRIVYVTGDIYVLANNCTLDFQYPNKQANLAYARSKLGVSWNAFSMAEHLRKTNSGVKVVCIHPGVVNTELVGRKNILKDLFLVSPEKSASAVIYALTEPDLKSGDYLHNARGLMRLPENDPVLDKEKRIRFWKDCNQACGLDNLVL